LRAPEDVPLKSYETEPFEDAAAVDPASENHQLVRLGVSVSDTSSATENGTMVVEDGVDLPDPMLAVRENEEEVEPPRRRRFSPPTREQLMRWIPFWGVILLGAIIRFWALGDKPLHHDESLHAYYSLQLLHNMEHWLWCIGQGSPPPGYSCYAYTPLLHGPFQFHFIALVYKISQLLGASDNGVNTTTVRILAATLGTAIVALPYFLRDYLGKIGAWLASFLLAVSPSMVYFSRFAREDIYMAFFTLLMVVGVARYIRDRKMRWLVIAAAGFAFSYATKEATFLTILVFGSFLGALIAWELGRKVPLRSRFHQESPLVALVPKTFAPITFLVYLVIAGVAAKILFTWVKAASIYITDNPNAANIFVQKLKDYTVAIVPVIGILLGVFVLILLYREMSRKVPIMGRRGLAKRVDPEKQPVLDTILTMPWTHWFFALLCGWTIFLLLFSVMLTNVRDGIGDGIWQGLYYWLQQQQVARGSQPWYYYLMLIPLYEQIGVVFAFFGIVRCIAKPTRFRLFLVYWFLANLFLYSWAAEKMPWLMIHITMPMLVLAAVGLEPFVVTCINLVKQLFTRLSSPKMPASSNENNMPIPGYPQARPRVGVFAGGVAILGVILAALLLLPTVHNMYEVSYVHPADGPHEMMVYVQTTTDVNIVMSKVDALDQKMFGGKHQMLIGVTTDATWPFAWYLRDYPNVCFDYPSGCPGWKDVPVIIAGGDNPYGVEQQYAGTASNPGRYVFHEYKMRSWWDEGYKPPACIPSSSNNNCAGEPAWGGVGPGLWLSYGDNPPPNAKFNLSLTVQHIWQWWWERRAIGDTGGAYDMVLLIRKDLSTVVLP
jgi:uncharacterized protein (TIGR03663 family)